VSAIEQLVDLLAAQYRWGFHPLKLLGALLAPVLVVWLFDRRLRALASTIADPEQIASERLPRTPQR